MSRVPRYLITRPVDQAGPLAAALHRAGIEPVVVPAIAIVPPPSYEPLDRALAALDRYDWVFLTSANGARALGGRLVSPARPATVAWAAVGPDTAAALTSIGVTVTWMPPEALGLRAAADLPAAPGDRVLWVRGDRALPEIARRLRGRGLIVDEVIAYCTVEAPDGSPQALAAAWREGLNGVVLASASAARGFAKLARAVGIEQPVGDFTVVAIGPVTAAAAAEAGWPPHLVAAEHDARGIVKVVLERSTRGAASL